MKNFILIITQCIAVTLTAQTTEAYYDFFWKPCEPGLARFYSTVQKTDSGWLRHDYFITSSTLQMRALYADKECKIKNGEAVYFHANGQLQARGRFVNDKREGIYTRYHPNGMMSDSGFYQNDNSTGIRYRWHSNGYVADSITRVNDSTEVQVSWFDDGSINAAGYLLNNELNGKWKYWHRNGTAAGEEVYDKRKVISKTYYNEDGSAQPDTALANSDAVFKNGGQQGWRRYLEKNVRWPENYQLVNTTQVTVGVSFSIDENGKVGDVELYVPFHPVFDKAAEEIIRKSPDWKPAMRNNRKTKAWYRQPLTFVNVE
ncbi:MAG TPA: energy transducer TonB [Chitinophagaceae bacterium]|nr:energy transducer TonB [Chitinophagaceae bacterium]HNU13892.1 energy transducer TonB [Chitinophagaceae bacterium]